MSDASKRDMQAGTRPYAQDASATGVFMAVLTLWIAYLALTIATPPSPAAAQLGLTGTRLHLIQLTVAVPYLITWLLAALGWIRVRRYAYALGGAREAPAFRKLAAGLSLLLASIVIAPFAGTLRNLFAALYEPLTIVQNYLYAWIPLAGFLFIFAGTRSLVATLPDGGGRKGVSPWALATALAVSAAYLLLMFTDSNRQTGVGIFQPTYFIPDGLIIVTIALPLMAAWLLGFAALSDIRAFFRRVPGSIYREVFRSWVAGFFFVIIASVLLELLLSAGSVRLLRFGVSAILVLIYAFLLLQAIGYAFIARGARRLTALEELS